MKELVSVEINGEAIIIGYSSMFIPTNKREQENNIVFKSLRLIPIKKDEEGDVFFFQSKRRFRKGGWKTDWFLIPEYGFMNVQSSLLDFYAKNYYGKDTTFDDFVEAIWREHYWRG